MNQHNVIVEQYEILIGWRLAFLTFFASVRDRTKSGDESLVLVVGRYQRELCTVEALVSRLAPYCELAPELQRLLVADRLEQFGFPILGYIYDAEGMHGGSIELNSKEELNEFMVGPSWQARQEDREVIITDSSDKMIYHSRKDFLDWIP